MLPGLDETFAAGIILGYHAMAGTPNAVLAHTQSSKAGCRYWYNGRESGEIAQTALVLGHYGVPVVLVTGDEATCAEARAFLGEGIVTVAVKKGISITCCEMLAPQRAWEMIRKAAAEALTRIPQCKPYKIDLPIRARLSFLTAEIADTAGCRLSKRVDATTYERTIESPLDIVRF
jgi:D-amino peptidase